MRQKIFRVRSGVVARPQTTGRYAILACALLGTACHSNLTLEVSNSTDGAEGSLRAAIDRANSNIVGRYRAITIEIPAGTYELTHCSADDDNAGGDLDSLTDVPLALVGKSGSVVIRQTCAGERVLDCHGDGLLTLRGVTITGGSVAPADPAQAAEGGGLRAAGDVNLEKATISMNSARGAAGVHELEGAAVNGGVARGGGLFVGGSLQANESNLTSNQAIAGAGADETMNGAPASGGGQAEGGGAYVLGAITFADGAVSDNQALGGDGKHASGGQVRGGGFAQKISSTAPVTLRKVNLSGNTAQGGGTQALVPGAEAMGGALASSGAVEANDVTATDNSARGGANRYQYAREAHGGEARGGALFVEGSTSIATSTFASNQAASGNGEYVCMGPPPGSYQVWCGGARVAAVAGGAVWTAGSLSVTSGDFSDNAAIEGRGGTSGTLPVPWSPGVSLVQRINLASGGALLSKGQLLIEDARIVGNTSASSAVHGGSDATLSGTVINGNYAGYALLVGGHLTIAGASIAGNGSGIGARSVSATALTVASNTRIAIQAEEISLENATITHNGAGVSALGAVQLNHVTLADNSAPPEGFEIGAHRLRSHASIAVGLRVCTHAMIIDGSSYNWFSDGSCKLTGIEDHESATFLLSLAPLADNGGPVPTRMPPPSLVDRIPASACSLQTDARGESRPQGPGCDPGAVETSINPETGADVAISPSP